MADQLGRSVGDMYEGAFIPGLVLALLYASYVFLACSLFPNAAPGLPVEAQKLRDPKAEGSIAEPILGGLAAAFFTYVFVEKADLPSLTSDYLPETVNLAVWSVGFLAILFYVMRNAARMMTPSLFITIAISAAIAIVAMRYTEVRAGADYVVLTMSVGVAVAFAIAVLNHLLRLRQLSALAERVIFVMVPPLALIFLVLGTIFIGVATPTEGGAMGASGALILAIAKGRLRWDLTRQAVESTAKLSAFVVFILVGARVFSLTFYGVDGHRWVEEMLVSLPGGQVGFLIFVNVFVFLLAFFLDFFEIAFIVIPLLGPAAERLGIDLIWFGVMLGVNMQTSFMHPPFGFALFYLRSVAPREPYLDRISGKLTQPITTGQIYWGAVPFVFIQCIMVALVITFPAMVMHYKGTGPKIDPSKVKIEIQTPELPPPIDFGPPKIQ
jgi:TRAP-type mannitol/chloroaromatic compound transport system permease large subunit